MKILCSLCERKNMKKKINVNNQVSVLLSSCDAYEDAWYPFFRLFNKFWNCPYKVYLNTETKTCHEEKVITLNSVEKNKSWSMRLKYALKRIPSKYIIFFLEDFFLLDYVNQNEINRCIDIMERDKKIAVIDFEYCDRCNYHKTEYCGYSERDLSSMYFLNCQTAIWRRKDLIRFLSPYESPWQFEIFGTERVKLYNKRFLCSSGENITFLYNVDWNDGYGLHGGKWLKSNIELFEKNNICVDFSRMGFYDGSNVDTECPAPQKCIKDRLMYLLYGGGEKVRMSIKEQIISFVKCPRKFFYSIKRKIKYCFSEERNI